MQKIIGFVSSVLVYFCAVMASSSVWAADSDGDGLADIFPVQITTGARHTCALDSKGVGCWGDNSYSQSRVPTLTNPVTVSAGGSHTCAIHSKGVVCWGANGFGQSTVPKLTDPVAVSAGGNHTCALHSGGVKCWGDNTYKQRDVPTLSNPVAVSAGQKHTCAIDDSGVKCWGSNASGKTTVPATLVNPVAVSAGVSHTCALDDNGITCWGYNQFKQLNVPALSNPVSVSANGNHTCALHDGGVKCWGEDVFDQTDVPSLTQPTMVSAGYRHTCAVSKRSVKCWGSNAYRQTTKQTLSFVADNCPSISNEDQADADGDDIGDVCDETPDPVVKTLVSSAARDGWTLESTASSQVGGKADSAGTTLIIGDNTKNQQYRSILHFDTASLPNKAVIIKATLTLNKQSLKGNVTPLGSIKLDIAEKYFGSSAVLEVDDFQAGATISSTAVLQAAGDVYTASLDATTRSVISNTLPTQFRIRFNKDDNTDKGDDYLKFYSGNAQQSSLRPKLEIQYYIPD